MDILKSIYDTATLKEVIGRVNHLKPESQNLWGKMNVSQMMAHCSVVLEYALGDKPVNRPLWVKILGPMAKYIITNDEPFKRNIPTAKEFLIVSKVEFGVEKKKLINLLTRFSEAGISGMNNKVHPFFGKLTAQEWSKSQMKHIDHHLNQFGV